jgi:HEAT repeat protein
MTNQIFISYSRKDGDHYARSVVYELQQNGFKHWMDTEQIQIGDEWPRKIDEALNNSFALVLILTQEAVKSPYVTYEWIYALGRGITVLPLLFDKEAKNSWHPKMDVLNYEDFTQYRPWNKVIDVIKKAHTEYPRPNTFFDYTSSIPPFVEKAADMLEDLDERVRHAAIDELAKSTHPAALRAIAQVAQDYHFPDVQIYAAFTLLSKTQSKDQRAIPGLLVGLRDNDDSKRERASRALINFGDQIIPNLIELLDDRFSETRYIAARTLGQLRARAALPKLLELLHDEHNKVADAAIEAIGLINDSSVAEQLKASLNKQYENQQLRIAAILMSWNDADAKPVLLKLIRHQDVNYVSRPAAEMLEQYGDEIAPNLIDVLKDQTSMFGRALAAELLRTKGNDSLVVPHLLESLYDKDGYVRGEAALALGARKVREAVPKLAQLLEDNDLYARHGAEDALLNIDIPEARTILEDWWHRHKQP